MKTHVAPTRGSGQPARRGAFAVIVMLALLLAALMGASLVKLAVAQHRQTRQNAARLQATSLANSGLSRARTQLQRDAGYEGGTWSVDARVLQGEDSGRVRISVDKGEEAGSRLVTVVAEYPADAERRVRVRRRIRFEIPEAPEEDTNTR